MEFFRTVHRTNPPFKMKVRRELKQRAKIPEMVRHHYKNPIELLPTLRDVLRIEVDGDDIKSEDGGDPLDIDDIKEEHSEMISVSECVTNEDGVRIREDDTNCTLNGFVKNGGDFNDVIKKENYLMSEFISGITTEGNSKCMFHFFLDGCFIRTINSSTLLLLLFIIIVVKTYIH